MTSKTVHSRPAGASLEAAAPKVAWRRVRQVMYGVLALLAAAACTRQVAPATSISAELHDFNTGDPVANAVVSLVEKQALKDVAVSDPAGRFALTRLGEKVTLEIRAAGKQPLRRTFRLESGEDRALDLFMVPEGGSLPDDTILFERGGFVWRTDSAGLNAQNLTADTSGVHASPTWNADRTQFAFIQRIPGRSQVVVRHADGSPARTVGDVPDSTSQLRWNPDGRLLAYAHSAWTARGQFTEIRAMDAFTGTQRDLVAGLEERDPAWSRDGRWLTWARFMTGRTWEVWIAGADGGATKALVTGYNAREPAWSPDGKRVAFASNREGDYNLYEMAVESPRPRRLTSVPTGGFARRPLYSPLGDEILFESNVHRGSIETVVNLYSLNLRTKKIHQVMDDAREAAW